MRFLRVVITITIAVVAVVLYKKTVAIFYEIPSLPQLEDTWWGQGEPHQEDTEIRPFAVNVSNEVLKDLQHRLSTAIPFQPPLEGARQLYGINTKILNDVTDFWRSKYDWRDREKFLNQYPQYTVSIQGLRIHYLHVKPQNAQAFKVVPLLLLHGWPGSVREFYEIIPLLTTPQKHRNFVFEVIVPSLPGYGFSEAAVRPGLGAAQVAVLFKNLMQRLGFEEYYIQGGDWGAIIVSHMATLFPGKVMGVHSNMCAVMTPLSQLKTIVGSFFPQFVVDKEDEGRMYPLSEKHAHLLLETGYLHIQATKPDTIGVALRDSPVGLAAYILEKFNTWTNPSWNHLENGGLTQKYSLTSLLDNIMIYWVTRSITTSMRLYSETFNKAQFELNLERIPIEVPSGCAKFTYELSFQPDSILREKFKNLVHSVNYHGGHFAAFEEPDVLGEDIYDFVETVQRMRLVQTQ